jgi:predicted kinase
MQNINIPLHTIIFTVAPSNAGKSYYCENYLLPQLKESYPDLNIQYLSSDKYRQELLGSDVHKHDTTMMQVSEQAFKLMYTKLEALMSFPITAELIVIDTTGLSDTFRNEMIDFGKKYNYNVIPLVFDYNDRNDYYTFKDEKSDTSIISKHVDRLKKETLRTLKKDSYKDVIRIRTKDFSSLDIKFEFTDYNFYKSHILTDNVEYCIVSDLHGCLNEFKEIIYKNNSTINENNIIVSDKIFIVQDYVDKGYDILNTINFIYNNAVAGKIKPIIGNHENYVYKRLKGEIKGTEHDYLFNTLELLLLTENQRCKEMFIELIEKYSKHFYKHKNFFVNHAPCEAKYLGKIDTYSLKNQRNFRYSKYNKDISVEENVNTVEKELEFIKKQTSYNSKPIVWGHVMVQNTKQFNNVHMIDTGCVAGNKLSSISFNTQGSYFIKTVPSDKNELINKHDILPIFNNEKIDKEFTINMLEPDQKRRLHYLIKNKVNFISGTVCPSDKNEGILEDLKQGLLYYKENGINKVILQPKYMGSRCNIYLNKDIEKTYATTRNGYTINQVDYKQALKPLYEIPYIKNKFENENTEIIILDSEILPWVSLGAGLVDEQFLAVKTGINTELELLKETGFEDQLNQLINHELLDEFKNDSNTLKKNDLIEKYNFRAYETFKNVLEYYPEHIPLSETEEYVKIYNRQMELFASPGEIEFKPFSILKEIKTDGSEVLYFNASNIEIFKNISSDKYCIVDFNDENWFEVANNFYQDITARQEMEGVVIKPEIVYNKGLAPYIKARNENYLSIVYGYDFKKKNKYEKLVKRKRIKEKLKSSIYEFEVGKKMLEIPYNQIDDKNKSLISLYIKMIMDEENVQKLDPRL